MWKYSGHSWFVLLVNYVMRMRVNPRNIDNYFEFDALKGVI